jgi:hypothetical protein
MLTDIGQFMGISHILIEADLDHGIPREIKVTGKAKTIMLRENSMIRFDGLPDTWMITALHPNGITYMSDRDSVPRFHSFRNLFMTPRSIWNDALTNTGWIRVE